MFTVSANRNPDLVSTVPKVKIIISPHCNNLSYGEHCKQVLSMSTTKTALRTDLNGLNSRNFLRVLAACSKIHKFLELIAVRFSTSCILNVYFMFLPRKNLLRHFFRVHYFRVVCIVIVQFLFISLL